MASRLQADGTLIIEKLKHGSDNKKTKLENDMFNESNGLLRCLDISGGIERASSRRRRAGMQFPKKFCPLSDKPVIESALVQLRSNFACIPLLFATRGILRKL